VEDHDPELVAANQQLLRGSARASLPPEDQNSGAKQKKEQEMAEIAALIRKAQASTNHAVEVSQRRELQQKQESQEKPNILADLDKIISNLERQKNLATFGLPKEARESQVVDETIQDYGDENDSFCYGAKPALQSNRDYTLPSDSQIDIANHSEKQEASQTSQRKWKTLKEARE
jgi:hypothetical protein